jgi:hypothetical protein
MVAFQMTLFTSSARAVPAPDGGVRQARDFRIAMGLMIAAGLVLTIVAFGARMG